MGSAFNRAVIAATAASSGEAPAGPEEGPADPDPAAADPATAPEQDLSADNKTTKITVGLYQLV